MDVTEQLMVPGRDERCEVTRCIAKRCQDLCGMTPVDRDGFWQTVDGLDNKLNLLQRMRSQSQPLRIEDVNDVVPIFTDKLSRVQVVWLEPENSSRFGHGSPRNKRWVSVS